jgi:hypothetical protein
MSLIAATLSRVTLTGEYDRPLDILSTGGTQAEQDTFTALAGSENGKQVFRMLANQHNVFQKVQQLPEYQRKFCQ